MPTTNRLAAGYMQVNAKNMQDGINNMHNRLDSLIAVSPVYLNKPALHLVRAMAPAGATYPRAAVVRLNNGQWGIRIKHHAVHYEGDYILDVDDKPLAFDLHRGALSHAAREINALRARRHPAGQFWLRAGGQ